MGRKKKRWSWSHGSYGGTVRIYEPRVGAPLRYDYRIGKQRERPEVEPLLYVRKSSTEPADPVLEDKAKAACKKKANELGREPEQKKARLSGDVLTVEEAFRLFHDPRRRALPESREARTHHRASRAFWEREIGTDDRGQPRLWNEIPPADLSAALLALKETGQVETAKKRLSNLHTVYVWLSEEMLLDVQDITRGRRKLLEKLNAGYEPTQPRLSPVQRKALRKAVPLFSWRQEMFYTLLMSSGTRGVQARQAMRSMLDDARVQPPPSPDHAPHGWFLFGAVKGQRRHLTFLTAHQRETVEGIIAGPLAQWEAQYRARTMTDYPLVPSGRIDRGELLPTPISDTGLRKELEDIFHAAGIPKSQGDRLGFHAVRRGWAGIVNARLGRTATKNAGGWSDEETVDVYLPQYVPEHISGARELMEEEEAQ